MNTKHATRNLVAERADDAGMVAYRAARHLGTEQAMAAYLSAYAAVMRGER